MAGTPAHEYLELRADRIECLPASHRLPVRVRGGAATSRWIRYHFTPAPGAPAARGREATRCIATITVIRDPA